MRLHVCDRCRANLNTEFPTTVSIAKEDKVDGFEMGRSGYRKPVVYEMCPKCTLDVEAWLPFPPPEPKELTR